MATKKTVEKSAAKTPAKKSASAKAPSKSAAKKTAAPKPVPEAASNPKTPAAHHDIAQLAHKYYHERGHAHGEHVEDWLRAERELNS